MAKQRLVASQATDEAGVVRRKPAQRRPRSRLFWLVSRLFILLLLLAVLGYFAPVIIAGSGLWKQLLAAAAPEIAKQVDVKSLQLNWLAPIEIRGLVVRDPAGQPLAEVPLIKSHKPLLAIALNASNVGTFDVDQPRAKIVLRQDGSNVEDLLAKLPKPKGKSSNVGFGLALTGGTVEFDDQVAGRQWQIENLAVELTSPAAADQPKSGKLSAALKSIGTDNSAGQLAAEFSLQPSNEKSPLGTGQAQLTLAGLPTEIAQGALRRFVGDIRPRGPLTVQAAGALKPDGAVQVLINNITTPGISVAAPKILATDQPTIVITSGQGAVQLAGKQLTIPNLQLASNLLTISGSGAAAIGSAAGGDLQITGQINAAALARQLPATLHMRADSKLDSGLADFTLASQAGDGGRRWSGSLKTRDFRGIAAGRPIEFEEPLQIDFGVQQTAAGPVIEKLVAQASFLRLEGRGSLAEGSLSARTNLDKLVAELERLIDWSQLELAGELAADVRWKHDQASGWNASADARATNFKLTAPQLAPWQEPNLHLTANVQGVLDSTKLSQINAGKLGIEAGADRLDAELIEVVKSPSMASVWPVKFMLHGDLASWRARLQPFAPLTGWGIAGAIDANGAARVSLQEAELAPTTVQINQLSAIQLVKSPEGTVRETIAIREPVIKVETSGAWNQAKSTLTLGTTTFASSALAFRADGLRAVLGKEPSVVGSIDLRGDLGKLLAWMPSAQPPTSRVEGALTGHMEIGFRGQALAANWTADIEGLKYFAAPQPAAGARTALASVNPAAQWQQLWDEPRINFAGQGTFDPSSSTLKIERTTLAASSASVGAAGTLTKLSTAPEIDLTGEIAYDLGAITRQIQAHAQPGGSRSTELPYGLDTLDLSGKEKRPFTLKGPLVAAAGNVTPVRVADTLSGEASLGWQGARYVGLVAGPADFRAKLAAGVVQIGPLDIPLAEGRLTTAPRMILNQPRPEVVVDRGPVLTNVRISPEMCTMWMKYVAPLVAEATRAEGKFSLSLENANLPLAAPLTGTAAGTFSIASAQIGPGPMGQQVQSLGRELLAFLKPGDGQASASSGNLALLSFPQQDVPFSMREGIVRHDGLKASIGELQIVTDGIVNVETEEFDLTASIGLPESLFAARDGLLASLRGQPLKIPLRGSFNKPPDLRGTLANLLQQNAGSAVRNVIGNQIERRLQGDGGLLQRGEGMLQRELGQGINRLFGPTQPAQPPSPR
jgi:translocation and assembly module TamB